MRWVRVVLFPYAVLVDWAFVTPVLGPRYRGPRPLDFGPPPSDRWT